MTELSKYAGAKIKSLRKEHKMTQSDLASKLNIGKSAISNYEAGYRMPKQDLLFALSDLFNCSINDFFPNQQQPETIAAHKRDDLTPEEQAKVNAFIEGLIANREN